MMRFILRKILIVTVAVINLMVAIGYTTPAGVSASEFYTENEKASFNETVGLLKSLGIIEEKDDTKMATTVSNQRFLQLAAGVLYGENATSYYKDVFKDMTDMINNPDADVTFENVAKVIVNSMGYTFYENLSGEYKGLALRIGFFDGISIGEKIHVTYADLIRAFDNALNTKVIEKNMSENKIEDGEILLTKVHKVREYRGIVTATDVTGILGNGKLSNNNIKIDGYTYETIPEAQPFLGKAVTYYLHEDDVIVYICETASKNNEIIIDSEDIESLENKVYTYYDGTKKRKAALATPFTAVINGIAATVTELDSFVPENGYIRLLDNNDDEKYDVVFVNSYEVFKVSVVDKTNEVIYIKSSTESDKLDLTTYENYTIMTCNGGNMKISDISAGDIVLLSKADTNDYIEIKKVTEYQEGILSAITDKEEATIDEKAYRLAKDYYAENKINVGSPVSFAVYNGKVVVIDSVKSTDDIYAVLVFSSYDENTEELTVKLFDEKGRMLKLNATNKIRTNEETVTCSQLHNLIKDNKHMLIKYSLNDEGKLAKIIVPPNYSVTEDYRTIPYDEADIKLLYSSTLRNEGSLENEKNLKTLGGLFAISNDTLVFEVPSQTANANDGDYKVAKMSSFSSENVSGDIYCTTENINMASIIVSRSKLISGSEHFIGVVKDMYIKLDENDVAREFVEFWGPPGKDFKVYRADSGLIGPYRNDSAAKIYKMDVGDIVHCKRSGKEATFNMVYDLENDYLAPMDVGREYGGFHHYIMGRAYSKFGNYTRFTKTRTDITDTPGIKDTEVYDLSQFRMVRVCTVDGRVVVESTSRDRIVDYLSGGNDCSKAFVYSNEGYPWTCILFEEE